MPLKTCQKNPLKAREFYHLTLWILDMAVLKHNLLTDR